MKRILLALVTLLAPQTVSAEPLVCDRTGYCKMTVFIGSGSKLHDSANDFARQVGEQLKAKWPSMVSRPNVVLAVPETHLRLYWTVQIVPTTPGRAEWSFDRRGTMLSGASQAEALAKVREDIQSSGKLDELPRSQGWFKVGITSSCTVGPDARYWCIEEHYFVAPKPAEAKK